jgi:hypothetical protein
MYRERPDGERERGWRFLSGVEGQASTDDPSNFAIPALTTIAEIDPDLVPFLNTQPPCALERIRADDSFRAAMDYNFEPERR